MPELTRPVTGADQTIVEAYNDLRASFIAILQKLDLDAGVTDTDYEATDTSEDITQT